MLHKWGFRPKVSQRRFVNIASKEEKEAAQKKAEKVILNIPEGFTVVVEDESVFLHDALIRRRMWTPKGIRPIVVTTGSHQKTYVFGTITLDGRQLFRQYQTFDQYPSFHI